MVLPMLLCGCSARYLIVQGVGNELANQSVAPEEDLDLAREASAFYLKLSESLLRESPGNLKLAQAVAGGFTQYAFAFVAFEAEKIESRDARLAAVLNERARRLYLRAYRHASAALELSKPGFAAALADPDSHRWPVINAEQIATAYWAAASWAAYISLSKDHPDVVADFPLAYRLAQLSWQSFPKYGDGALAGLMGTLEASRPGGSLQRADQYFDESIAYAAGASAGPYVAKAEAIAQAEGNRVMFETLLQQALAASAAHRNVANEVMRARATWLLATADDLF